MLASGVNRICVAYDNMSRWFPENKIVFTGNPIRQSISRLESFSEQEKEKGLSTFGMNADKCTVLVIGGSLGALTINESIIRNLDYFIQNDIQLIWQTGKSFHQRAKTETERLNTPLIKVYDFIYEMEQAYSLADIIISRAGAIAISELCIVGKPCILIPSPNVAEDHQTKNANSLAEKHAALMVRDIDSREHLIERLDTLVKNIGLRDELSKNIKALGIRNADERIVEEIEKIIRK